MGLFFADYRADGCCLCGSTSDLTGEHKIKASALRAEFGAAQMAIGRSPDPRGPMRFAQGPKSKALHFEARICGPCNSARTQAADLEFDRFHQAVRAALDKNQDPAGIFDDPRYEIGSEPYLNVFRYFAKLLCCHLAESGGPRPLPLALFAIGTISVNGVSLSIDRDWTYERVSEEFGPMQYAAHGGLVVYGHKVLGHATGFHSTLTLGPLQYVFFCELLWPAQLELVLQHRTFSDFCQSQIKNGRILSKTDRLALGFSSTDSAK